MMTRSTSKTRAALLQAAVLPLITGLILLMCIKTVAQEKDIDYSKVNKIVVLTSIQEELDSLREADPAKYKNEPYTRIMRTDYTMTENGKEKVVTTFDKHNTPKSKLSERTMDGIAAIDPEKIQNINVNRVSDEEMDSLKGAEPEYYKDAKAEDYKCITVVYLDDKGKQVKKTYYENNTPLNYKALQEQDRQPQFSEGSFHTYVLKQFKVPEIKENLDVKVYVSFVVETDGSLSDIKILRDPGRGMGDQIKKIVEDSPKWHPAIIDGQPTRMSYTLPIRIMVKN